MDPGDPSPAPGTAADDSFAAALRGFGPTGILASLLVLTTAAVLGPLKSLPVLAWAALSRTPWSAIGFVRPRSWLVTIATGVVAGAGCKLALKAVVLPPMGAPPINPTYHFLVGNTAALPAMMFSVLVGAAFGEEVVFRGYLFERLGRWLGNSATARVAIVTTTAVLFGLAHLHDQGISGAEQATIVGLLFGGVYAATGQLPLLMIAHAAFDVTAVLIIYFDLELRIAHLFFR